MSTIPPSTVTFRLPAATDRTLLPLTNGSDTLLVATLPTVVNQPLTFSEAHNKTFDLGYEASTIINSTISVTYTHTWLVAENAQALLLVYAGPSTTSDPAPISTPNSDNPNNAFPAPTSNTNDSATTTSTSPTASTTQAASGTNLSAGAIAGTVIGCLIAGALLAGLVFWFFWKKRRASLRRDHEASRVALMPQEKGFSSHTAAVGNIKSNGTPLAENLPLPLEDKAITGEISKISNSIKNHVQSYYHTGRVNPGLIDIDDVQSLGSDLPIPAETLTTLLSNSTTRELALRFCIAWVACSRMLPNTASNPSLLPSEVAGFSHKQSTSDAASLARWRSSSAGRLHSTYVENAFSTSDSRNKSIQATISVLDNVLQPYADSRVGNEERRRNLEEILKRCASFAFTLFSQPSTWDFDWKAEQSGKNGEICIFPALVQLTDEHGADVRPPRPFSEAVVRKLDE